MVVGVSPEQLGAVGQFSPDIDQMADGDARSPLDATWPAQGLRRRRVTPDYG